MYAEELGGPDVVSANVYRTRGGDVLKPCEMPAATVLAFLHGWAGAERFAAGLIDGLDAPARARWPLDDGAEAVRGAGVKA